MSDELTREYGATNEELQEHMAEPEGAEPVGEAGDTPATSTSTTSDDPDEESEAVRRGMPGHQ